MSPIHRCNYSYGNLMKNENKADKKIWEAISLINKRLENIKNIVKNNNRDSND